MITFRLNDALPSVKLDEWKLALGCERDDEIRAKIEAYLDAGHGACYLRNQQVAGLVESTLLHFDLARYRLIAWIVMPNHVHVLSETFPGFPMSSVLHSWKSYTSKEANRVLNRNGTFWQRDYFDRFIRDAAHLGNAIRYIHDNSVNAGLCASPEDWPFSSASWERRRPAGTHYNKCMPAGGTPALPLTPSTAGREKYVLGEFPPLSRSGLETHVGLFRRPAGNIAKNEMGFQSQSYPQSL